MNEAQLKHILVCLYIAIVLVFIIGILTADIYLFVASTVIVLLSLSILLNNPQLITINKKLKIGSEVAYKKTFYLSNILLFYISIAIITLRNDFPTYEIVGYVLLAVVVMNMIIFSLIQKNIEKEYLR